MDIVTLLIVIGVLCVLLWIVNASGWMAVPPPVTWIFNIIVLIVFIVIVLKVSGVYSFHDYRIGGP
jgi:hypothetical protein